MKKKLEPAKGSDCTAASGLDFISPDMRARGGIGVVEFGRDLVSGVGAPCLDGILFGTGRVSPHHGGERSTEINSDDETWRGRRGGGRRGGGSVGAHNG